MNGRAKRRDKRGVALLLVITAIAIMTVMLTEFQDEASGDLAAAISDRDALKAEYLARSGINLSRLLIAAEPTIRKAMSILFMGMQGGPPQIPVWEYADRVLGAFNDKEGSEDFAALTGTDMTLGENLGIEGGKFEVTIVDEDAKINVNVAARSNTLSNNNLAKQLLGLMAGDQYSPMFENRDRDDQFTTRQDVCSAIIDWADLDEELFSCDQRAAPSSQAVEDNSYHLLKDPYWRKNAAYDSLDELHLVRGVGDDYWATFVDPEPTKPRKRVMTVWGQGAVNVNTANAQTLLAIVCAGTGGKAKMCLDPLEAQKFLMLVTMLQGFTMGMPLFPTRDAFINTMQGGGMFGSVFTMLGIEKVVFDSKEMVKAAISTESKMFSIYSDGIVPGYQRKTRVRVHAVVDFRDAPAPGAAPMPTTTGTGQTGTGQFVVPGTAATTGATGATGALGPDSIAGALAPNPGGTVIYYRTE
jgi:general secretion pathway protein K